MLDRLTLRHVVVATIILLAPLFAVGWLTRADPTDAPYLKILGGGFIFNYRIADVHYGFTAVVARPLESGSVIEAVFEDPGGGPPLVVRERVSTMTDRYALRSPPVRGVEAGRPYKVDVNVFDRLETRALWTHSMNFRSQISDASISDQPLTIGPGYHRNPDAVENHGG